MKSSRIQKQYFLTYSYLFGRCDSFSIIDTLKSMPTITAIEKISFMLSQIANPILKDKSIHPFTLFKWVLKLASEDNKIVSKFIQEKNPHNDVNFQFINVESCLMLIEYLLENNNCIEQELSEEQESNLFKAYLWCAEITIKKEEEAYNLNKKEDIPTVVSKVLPVILNNREIDTHKDYRIQLIKVKYFFEFCETDSKYNQYLALFLKEYNIDCWNKYLLFLCEFYLKQITSKEPTNKFNIEQINPELEAFIDHFCLKEFSNYERSDDYSGLRNTPILRHGGNCWFLFYNFFVDKIYQGFLFDFASILNKNNCKISNYGSLKSDLGEKFFEHINFYKIMDSCFVNYTKVRLKGEFVKKILSKSEPDYYMRQGRKVFVFEFKDSTLNAETKHSGDYNKAKLGIIEKFEKSSIGHNKGITQIIRTIKDIHNAKYNIKELDPYDPQKIIIYPLIVHTDSSFEVEGTNYILKERFRELLIKEGIQNTNNIKDITLLNLDTFISLQDLFHSNKLKLSTCINEYNNYTQNKENNLNALYPFDKFLFELAYNKGYRNLAPEIFNQIKREFVENENVK